MTFSSLTHRIFLIFVTVGLLTILYLTTNSQAALGDSAIQYISYQNSPDRTIQINAAPASQLTSSTQLGLFAEPSLCEADSQHLSPTALFLLVQDNCHGELQWRLIERTTHQTVLVGDGYFLTWLAGEQELFLVKTSFPRAVVEVNALTQQTIPLNLPKEVYEVSAHPLLPTQLFFASTIGLGYSSKLGVYDLTTDSVTILHELAADIIAHPQISPDGTQIAFITMPHSNIPFPLGKLWVADITFTQSPQFLSDADAGHGYRPEWSPSGSSIAFIYRENPDSLAADHSTSALASNIYVANVTSGTIDPQTDFNNTLVYDIAWSPEGEQIAFTAADGIWVTTLNTRQSERVTAAETIARHPLWLAVLP